MAKSASKLGRAVGRKATEGEPRDGACRLLEFVAVSGSTPPRVDKAAGLISGVKILGASSCNNREYAPAALRQALDAKLYEGKPVNVDHVEGSRRSYRDRIGKLEGINLREDGIYGDLRVNAAHPLAEQLFWDAEHAPENVGLSHDARGKTVVRRGKVIVESIDLVRSVDLVADPATTSGLFEGELADKIESEEHAEAIRKINSTAMDLIHRAVWDEEEDYPTLADKKARVQAILAEWETELEKVTEPTETEEAMNLDKLTVDELRAGNKDLLESIQTEATKPLAEELAETKAKLAALERTQKLSGLLREAKIDEATLPDSIRESLASADEDKLPKLIEDIGKLVDKQPAGQQPGQTPTSTGPAQAPARFEDRVSAWA
jgi:cell division septum initiation protein DivIVA